MNVVIDQEEEQWNGDFASENFQKFGCKSWSFVNLKIEFQPFGTWEIAKISQLKRIES